MRNLLICFIFVFKTSFSQKSIQWQAWGESAFKTAKKEHKPVFLDVGTEWCTACNLMEEKTYTDTTVVGILNRNFVTIKADAEAQPDVGARFLEWGWPALIFLDSSGNQLQAFQGHRQPSAFKNILLSFLEKYKQGNLSIQDNDFFTPERSDSSDLDIIYKRAHKQLDYYYDSLYAGWGYALKIPLYQPVEYCFWLAGTSQQNYEKEKALRSLAEYSKISDRICGGVYFGCSSGRNWTGAAPEKRSEYQGGILHNYAEAFLATKDPKWWKEAQLIKKYLMETMYSKEDNLFYNSQEEYISLNDLSKVIEPEKYFKLPQAERAKYGFPPIDKTLYTDVNFRIVKGFLKLYEATHDSSDLNIAIHTAKKVMATAWIKDRGFKTVIDNKNTVKRMRDLPSDSAQKNVIYLKPQSHAAIAMLALYQNTGDSLWLQYCKTLHAAVYKQLYDTEMGGMFSTNLMPVSLGGKKAQTKVLVENGLYARFLIELSDLTGEEEYLKIAESCVRSVSSEKIVKNEERLIADYVMAIDKLRKQHLVFSVVSSDPNSIQCREMLQAIQSYYHPAKLVKVETPGHYPDMGKPALFVCSKNVCSQPIFFSINTKKEIDDFIKKLKN
jgi:uncharacterized protein YyaL (SSP411 family)